MYKIVPWTRNQTVFVNVHYSLYCHRGDYKNIFLHLVGKPLSIIILLWPINNNICWLYIHSGRTGLRVYSYSYVVHVCKSYTMLQCCQIKIEYLSIHVGFKRSFNSGIRLSVFTNSLHINTNLSNICHIIVFRWWTYNKLYIKR